MKLFFVLSLFFLIQFCCADLTANVSKSSYDEVKRRILKCIVDNGLPYQNGLEFVDQKLYEKVCDVKNSNGEWTVIQRRMDGSVNFYRNWNYYKVGFGTITGEFFIGLENLHMLITCAPQELRIEMEDHENNRVYAKYDLFEIGDESERYALKELGNYEGDAGDSLSWHKSLKFSTHDREINHEWLKYNCAHRSYGGWWYKSALVCHMSNLNGQYGNNNMDEGIIWKTFQGSMYSLKKVEMKIRPKKE